MRLRMCNTLVACWAESELGVEMLEHIAELGSVRQHDRQLKSATITPEVYAYTEYQNQFNEKNIHNNY